MAVKSSKGAKKKKRYGYKPAILFAAKDRVASPALVPFSKHRVATFPKVYKTQGAAIRYARREIVRDPDVHQLPSAKRVRI